MIGHLASLLSHRLYARRKAPLRNQTVDPPEKGF